MFCASFLCIISFYIEKQLQVIPPYGVGDVEVDSSNLFAYLITLDDSYFKGKVSFAPELDLEIVEPYLRRLHSSEKIDFVLPLETREKFEERINFVNGIQHDVIKEIEQQRNTYLKELAYDQEAVERAQCLYYDRQSSKILITPTVHDSYSSTTIDTFNIFQEGDYPLFEIHTHPVNSLFSELDYLRMMMNFTPDFPYRILKGAIVLCPDFQIMALATPETKLLLPKETDNFLKEYDLKQSDLGRQIIDINTHLMDKINEPFNKGINFYVESLQKMAVEEKNYEHGLYSENEKYIVFNSIGEEFCTNYSAALNELNYFIDYGSDDLRTRRRKLYFQNELEIARDVNPKLYMATDFRHFKAFTA